MGQPSEPAPLVVLVPDSPNTRLLIELSSHGTDLVQAERALDLAQGPDWADDADLLIASAVVAYCRCFVPSHVRSPLSAYADVPTEHAGTHDHVRAFRNATVAHSQSDLAVTYALGVADATSREVRYATGLTVSQTLPPSVIRRFAALIAAMQRLVGDLLEPVHARAVAEAREAGTHGLVSAPPDLVHRLAEDFQPRTKRPLYATGHPLYWDWAQPKEHPS